MSDWIEWRGGECPVGPYTVVNLKTRSYYNRHDTPYTAAAWRWTHEDKATNIIAYRIVKPAYEGEAVSATIAHSGDT